VTDIHGSYQRLSADPDFADVPGMALGRVPVGDVLTWEITVESLDLDDEKLAKLRSFAEREGLAFAHVHEGKASLRLPPTEADA